MRGSIEDRLLITDSRGQHKDNRSLKRLTAAEVEAVEVPIVQQGEAVTDRTEYQAVNYDIF